jgi:micrococcal nuclease
MPRSRALPYLLAAVLAIVALLVARRDQGGEEGAGKPGGTTQARVSRVVDGDTIVAQVGGRRERVRYIGVDTPESVKPGTRVQCFAKAASAENERLVQGRTVRLEFDRELRDRYGRLLAYVVRADGVAINETLLRGGFARTIVFPPNTRHRGRFAAIERDAQNRGAGLWSACPGR